MMRPLPPRHKSVESTNAHVVVGAAHRERSAPRDPQGMATPVSATLPATAATPSPTAPLLGEEEYRRFRTDGFLVRRGVLDAALVAAVCADGERLLGSNDHPADQQWFPMLHRRSALHERVALDPRLVDPVAALVGPDVMLLQTMLFLKPPGERGNGWHQDAWYLQTLPESLIGAWIALEPCDAENGALVAAVGSHVEPIYGSRAQPHPDMVQLGLPPLEHPHDPDDARNDLAPRAGRYRQAIIDASPGDVVFLHGHLLHTSLPNRSRTRRRRAFVAHYANARSATSWGASYPPGHPQHAPADPAWGGLTNGSHVLARGTSHFPTAPRRFS